MSLSAKRILKEMEQLRNDPSSNFTAQVLNNNIYEWHFTMRGPEDSDYSEGIYHGNIDLPIDYPIKPPNIYFLTPNGRFDIKKKICLSITKFHPENWNPSWTIRVMIEGLIQHFHVKDFGIGSVSSAYNSQQIKSLALESHQWKCDICGPINQLLPPRIKKQEVEITDQNKQSPAKILEKQLKKQEENNEKSNQIKEEFSEKQQFKQAEKSGQKDQQNIDKKDQEEEIPSSKKQHEQLRNILFQQFFNSEGQNLIFNRINAEQPSQDQLHHNQMEYFEKIYKYMEEEELVLHSLKTNKDQSHQQNEQQPLHQRDVVHDNKIKQQIKLANLILVSLIFVFLWINLGNFLEQRVLTALSGE